MSTQRKLLNSHALAVYQAAALKNKHDAEGVNLASDDDAALLLQRHRGAVAGTNSNLKLTRELIEYLAMAQGMHDGLAGLGVDSATYEYMPNHRYIRIFCSAIPIPFSAFDGIRRSRHAVQLTEAQEENVMKSFDKVVRGCLLEEGKSQPTRDASHTNDTHDTSRADDSSNTAATGSSSKLAAELSVPLPFVSAFFDQRCPELRSSLLNNSRCGATYLLLAVITGHRALCERCLRAGMSANHMSFLRDGNPPAGEMFHGYSPLFMAVLAEQVEILDLLWRHGGRVWVYDRWGRTPLHAAVAMNSKEMVQWLLAHGSPRYVGDCLNLTPAEGADEAFYFLLAIPNLALHNFPVPQKRSVVLAPSCLLTDKNTNNSNSSSSNGAYEISATPAASGSTEADTAATRGMNADDRLSEACGAGEADEDTQDNDNRASDGHDKTDTESEENPAQTGPAGVMVTTSPMPAASSAMSGHTPLPEEEEKQEGETGLCHCGSGRPSGYCGCVDDMFLRWSSDRLRMTWSAGVDYLAIAQRHVCDGERKHHAGAMGTCKKY